MFYKWVFTDLAELLKGFFTLLYPHDFIVTGYIYLL